MMELLSNVAIAHKASVLRMYADLINDFLVDNENGRLGPRIAKISIVTHEDVDRLSHAILMKDDKLVLAIILERLSGY